MPHGMRPSCDTEQLEELREWGKAAERAGRPLPKADVPFRPSAAPSASRPPDAPT